MTRLIGHIGVIIFSLGLVIFSFKELNKINSINTKVDAEIVEIYTEDDREYCVYDFVSKNGIIITKDIIPNIHKREVGETLTIYYNEKDNYIATEYRISASLVFVAVIVIGICLAIVVIVRDIIY